MKWPDGTPKSTGNAFTRRKGPSLLAGMHQDSDKQRRDYATRVNRYSDLCAFVAPEHTAKILKAKI